MRRLIYIFIILLIGVICFFVGRSTIESEIQYIKGDTIHDTIEVEKLVPSEVEVPSEPILPKTEENVVDTAAIIKDYISKKSYSIVAFDDSKIGKLELFPVLQYNKLTNFDYSFTPIQQRISIKPKFTPFVATSYSTSNYVGLGGGFFYHNLGVEYQYMINLQKHNMDFAPRSNEHQFGLKYKFR